MIIEIRAAEGGEDSKQLIYDLLKAYTKKCTINCL